MKPPIPEVFGVVLPSNTNVKRPFFGLNVVVVIDLILFVVMSLLAFDPDSIDLMMPATYIAPRIFSSIYLVCLFFLWRGSNWARWIFIFVGAVMSFGSIIEILIPDTESTSALSSDYISTVWTFGVGIWLLMPGVARHFKSS